MAKKKAHPLQKRIDDIVEAWTEPEINKEGEPYDTYTYLDMWQERLKRTWPTLAYAVENLIKEINGEEIEVDVEEAKTLPSPLNMRRERAQGRDLGQRPRRPSPRPDRG